jgi:uncharacterized protein (UPF0548 family)
MCSTADSPHRWCEVFAVTGSADILAALSQVPLTYQPGGNRDLPPAGYRRASSVRSVPAIGFNNEMAWDQAAMALMTWEVHRRAGVQVTASDDRVTRGGVAILRLGIGPLAVTSPVCVVDVIDEEDVRGFAYATLPGHPVSGVELFLLSRDISSPKVITAAVTAVSRPAVAAMRLAGPIGRLGQRAIADRYAREMIRGIRRDGFHRRGGLHPYSRSRGSS